MTENLKQLLNKRTVVENKKFDNDPLVGTVLGQRFKIVECLGQGAMARVYKANQTALDRLVAIKRLILTEPDMVARFEHEIKIHSRLQHKNIVEALDCVKEPSGQTYFVMEFLQGRSLQQLMKEHKFGLKSEEDIYFILSQAAEAVDYAHRQGVIHRDLKPANLVLIERDGEIVVKVVDFGLAKLQEQMQKFTKTGRIVGSPLYMSPEQCSSKELDSRTDIYSLGLLAYELITGVPPYHDSKTLVEVMHAHCSADKKPEPITMRNETIRLPNRLEAVLAAALETDRGNRFQSAKAFEQALRFWYKSVASNATEESIEAIPIDRGELPVVSITIDHSHSSAATSGAPPAQMQSSWRLPELVTTRQEGGWGIVSGEELRYIPQCDPVAGKTLNGRYKMQRIIGEGGMSIVYKAQDVQENREVAIKTLKFMQPEMCHRFAREIEIHSELKHPNIVRVFDQFSLSNGQTFFVMELLNGTVFEDYLDLERRVNEMEDICSILSQICDALEFAHDAGVIHRDLKPGNIMLVEQQGSVRVKVLDFGLATVEEDLQRFTRTGVLVGSPAYMSPEHCLGKPLSTQSDLYSLGVLAFEMISGTYPFQANTDIGMVQAHSDAKVIAFPLSDFRQDLPALAEIEKTLSKVLEKDSANRHQSIEEFRQELDNWWKAAGKPDQSSPFKQRKRRKRKIERAAVDAARRVEATGAVKANAEELESIVNNFEKRRTEASLSRLREPRFDAQSLKTIKMMAIAVLVFVLLGSVVLYSINQPRGSTPSAVESSAEQPAASTAVLDQPAKVETTPTTTNIPSTTESDDDEPARPRVKILGPGKYRQY